MGVFRCTLSEVSETNRGVMRCKFVRVIEGLGGIRGGERGRNCSVGV